MQQTASELRIRTETLTEEERYLKTTNQQLEAKARDQEVALESYKEKTKRLQSKVNKIKISIIIIINSVLILVSA